MNLPSYRDLVDAELPLSEEELNRIWTASQQNRKPTRREMAIFFTTFFAPLFLILGVVAYFNKHIHSTGHPKLIFTAVVLVMVGWMMFAMTRLMRRPWYASAFRRELCRRGHPVCISCGYSLRGLRSKHKRCPECGTKMWRKGMEETA